MNDEYILDACALIAVANKEKGADIVNDMLQKAESGEISLSMNIVNLLEAYYDQIRTKGSEAANDFLKSILASSIEIYDTVTDTIFREAARFKTSYKISLGDSFACATASCFSGTLVTSDYELKAVEDKEAIDFCWIRSPSSKK
jgi:ribonuclease VapC